MSESNREGTVPNANFVWTSTDGRTTYIANTIPRVAEDWTPLVEATDSSSLPSQDIVLTTKRSVERTALTEAEFMQHPIVQADRRFYHRYHDYHIGISDTVDILVRIFQSLKGLAREVPNLTSLPRFEGISLPKPDKLNWSESVDVQYAAKAYYGLLANESLWENPTTSPETD